MSLDITSPDTSRYSRSSTTQGSGAERSPSPPRRLDEAFATFLAAHLSSPDADPHLARLVADRDVLNPFAPGDKADRVTRLFVEEADAVRRWIPDGSALKRRLWDFPAVFRRLWPAEEVVGSSETRGLSSSKPDDVGKRKRAGGDEEEAAMLAGEEEEEGGDDPGEASAKRRRLGIGTPVREWDSPFGSRAESDASEGEFSASPFPGTDEDEEEGPVAAGGPSDIPLPVGLPAEHEEEDSDGEEEEEEEEEVEENDDVYTPPSTPPSSTPSLPGPPLSPEQADPSQASSFVANSLSRSRSPSFLASSPSPGPPFTPEEKASAGTPSQAQQHLTTTTDPPPSRYFSTAPFAPVLPPPPCPPTPPDIDSGPVEIVDADERLRGATRLERRGREWMDDTAYNGTRQPPLGVRVEHMLNFLREEDVDRCRGWEGKVGEIEGWLGRGWGGGGGGDGEAGGEGDPGLGDGAGTQLRNMVQDVKRKVSVHRLFEREKYGPAEPGEGIKSEAEVARPRRGRRMVADRDARAVELGEKVEDEGPRRVLVAAPARVHTQFHPVDSIDDHESREVDLFLRRLNESEKAFWRADPESDGREEYLFNLENAAYEACSASTALAVESATEDARGGLTSSAKPTKFMTKDGRGGLILPAEEELPPPPGGEPDELDARLRRYATERGARRAALQGALRSFTNMEQDHAMTDWNRVVPAVEQSVVDEVRRDLDRNYQWQPAELDWGTASARREELETMPYTFLWRLHRILLADLAEHVRKGVNENNAHTEGWVNVPKGVAYGGPFLWRMVHPHVMEQQDLLKECEAVFKAILRTPGTGGEGDDDSILQGVKRYARNGADGRYGTTGYEQVPEEVEVELGCRDNRVDGVRSVTKEELKWLGFLTSKSVNKDMLEVTQQSQPVLYLIFAARLEKAMDDRSEAALFLEPDQWRTIGELLDVINRPDDQSCKRVRFSPFQARYFLERAQEQGLCRYKHDHLVYGRVARSIREIEPAHRIKIPVATTGPDGSQVLTPIDKDHIASFCQLPAVSAKHRQQNRIFFLTLGLRLGVTIFRLRKAKERQYGTPLGTKPLRDALHTFDRVYRDVKEEHGLQWDNSLSEPGLSLARFVKNIDPAVWGEHIRNVPPATPSGHLTVDTEDTAMEEAALRIIRQRIVQESNENLSMLGRGREVRLRLPDGSNGSAWARDHNWDWASVEVRGKAKRFFSLDRWPLELQSEETRAKIQRDEFIDPNMVAADLAVEDPIPRRYFRPTFRRYGEDKRFRDPPGPTTYPIGDTPLQRRRVRGMLADRLAGATGVYAVEKPQTWKERLADMWRLERWLTSDHHAMAETSLPEADPSLVPESWTPPANSPRNRREGEVTDMEDEDGSGGYHSAEEYYGEDEDDVQMEDA